MLAMPPAVSGRQALVLVPPKGGPVSTSDSQMTWEALFARRTLGVRLGLEIVEAAYAAMGRPAHGIPSIHIVGTNGKGSTAALAEHALRGRGLRTGLYTSPHLHRVGERVRVGGRPVDDDRLRAHVEAVLRVEAGLELPRPLSFFELLTLAALDLVQSERVDVVIVEAGLGARRDATRVLSASTVGITSIALDHQESIGPTLCDIAREKAGAMAPGVPAFTAPQPEEVMAVLHAEAARVGCPLQLVEPRPRAPVGLAGDHQRHNAAVALAVGGVLVPGLRDADLDGVVVPGRLERISSGRGELWLDVAHNPHGIAAVIAAIRSHAVPMPSIVVFGCHADKDRAGMVEPLRTLGSPLWWVPLGAAAGPERHSSDRRFEGEGDPRLWPALDDELARGARILVCGSHALVGALRARAQGSTEPAEPQDPRPSGAA